MPRVVQVQHIYLLSVLIVMHFTNLIIIIWLIIGYQGAYLGTLLLLVERIAVCASNLNLVLLII